MQLIEKLTTGRDPSTSGGRGIRYKMDVYHGSSKEDVSLWLFSVRRGLEVMDVPREKWVAVASSYLVDGALLWFRRKHGESPEMTFEEFEQSLLEAFQPRNHQQQLRLKLYDLRQHGSLSEYVSSFMALMNQVLDMQEVDKIFWFIRELAPVNRGIGLGERIR